MNDKSKTISEKIDWFFDRFKHIPYVSPALAVIFILAVVPTLFVLLISLTNYNLAMNIGKLRFVGLSHYIRLFSGKDIIFNYSLFITIFISAVIIFANLIVGYIFALLLDAREFRLKGVILAGLIAPIVVTPSIMTQVWVLMLNAEFGVVNYLIETLFGVRPAWLSPELALFSVSFVMFWFATPYVALILYAGLRTLPTDPYEAAEIDGANFIQRFRYITLPLMKPLIILVLLMRFIDMFKTFEMPFLLTSGGPGYRTTFLGLHLYKQGFGVNGFLGYSSAISVVLILLVVVLSMFLIRIMRKNKGLY